mgnify:CR=1 FL=1
MQILDIINGSIQDVDLAHLLHGLGAGNVQLQRVKAAVDVPVIPKLTPNVDRIEDIGLAALEAGAAGA